jgi:hypothetical protein
VKCHDDAVFAAAGAAAYITRFCSVTKPSSAAVNAVSSAPAANQYQPSCITVASICQHQRASTSTGAPAPSATRTISATAAQQLLPTTQCLAKRPAVTFIPQTEHCHRLSSSTGPSMPSVVIIPKSVLRFTLHAMVLNSRPMNGKKTRFPALLGLFLHFQRASITKCISFQQKSLPGEQIGEIIKEIDTAADFA